MENNFEEVFKVSHFIVYMQISNVDIILWAAGS